MMFKTLITAGAALFLSSGIALAETTDDKVASTVIAAEEIEDLDTLIYTVRLRMAYGPSTWAADLGRSYTANPLKLRYIVEPSCRAPYVTMYLRSAVTGLWHKTRREGDVDSHLLTSFDGIRFDIDQPYLSAVTCEFAVTGRETGPGRPDNGNWGTGVLSGGVEYAGGFGQNLEVSIPATQRIRGFRLSIPEFCGDLEVLEAGTVTEGIFDPATLVDARKNIYEVAGGTVRSSVVRFSVNGPFDSRCFIPVFTYAAD
jgi:hypothetical protein